MEKNKLITDEGLVEDKQKRRTIVFVVLCILISVFLVFLGAAALLYGAV